MTETPPTVAETRREEAVDGDTTLTGRAVRPGTATSRRFDAAPAPGFDPAYRAVQTVLLLLGFTELILALRVTFLAVAADHAGVVSFIYTISAPLVAPWEPIHGYINLTSGGLHPLDLGALVAMFVYMVCAYLVTRGIRIITSPRGRVSSV
jgi:hypothetical protein